MKPEVSIIIPIHNGEKWINSCFESVLMQTALKTINLEICVCNDSSTDDTSSILQEWTSTLKNVNIPLIIYTNQADKPLGVGYSKNKAVSISSADYLCFQDIDDIMLPNRIQSQYNLALNRPVNTIIGAKFKRIPEDSTKRYTKWANSLTQEQLNFQIYTAHGPTIIMPTWFCHRSVFDSVGGFAESGYGVPEDLIFFYKHLELGGKICRVDECLLIYYYHSDAITFSILEDTIWKIRIEQLQKNILSMWSQFTIWNAGKQGRRFYKSLTNYNQNKVIAMCDVNTKKLGKSYLPYNPNTRSTGCAIKIIHFTEAQPPFVICVKMDMTNGEFEQNLKSLNLLENQDYVYFS